MTNVTGAVALGVTAWEPDLSTVHVARLDGRHGVVEYGVTHHEARFVEEQCLRLDADFLIAPAVATIFGAMSLHPLDKAVVIGDSAVHQGWLTVEDLIREAGEAERFPYSRSARFATRLVDGRAESAGESLARFLFWRQGVPCPDLQFRVDGPGGQVAYLDFMWEEAGVGGEFDGKQKYMRSAVAGEEPGDVVFREKRREDWILEAGSVRTMRRLVWADLFTPARTAARFREAIDRGLRRNTLV
jgi:hypothetical protein